MTVFLHKVLIFFPMIKYVYRVENLENTEKNTKVNKNHPLYLHTNNNKHFYNSPFYYAFDC